MKPKIISAFSQKKLYGWNPNIIDSLEKLILGRTEYPAESHSGRWSGFMETGYLRRFPEMIVSPCFWAKSEDMGS